MSSAVSFPGSARWSFALQRAGQELTELHGVPEQAGLVVVPAVRRLTPRLTGRLQASVTATREGTGLRVSSPLVYAGKIHARFPYMTKGVDASSEAVLDVYQNAAEQTLNHLEGRY